MKRRRNPYLAKKDQYEKEYRFVRSNPRSRRNWSADKKKVKRKSRRKINQALSWVAAQYDNEMQETFSSANFIVFDSNYSYFFFYRERPETLRKALQYKIEKRIKETLVPHFFKGRCCVEGCYSLHSALDSSHSPPEKELFCNFLSNLIEDRYKYGAKIASYLYYSLHKVHSFQIHFWNSSIGFVLEELFEEEPQWETLLKNWIELRKE